MKQLFETYAVKSPTVRVFVAGVGIILALTAMDWLYHVVQK